MKLLPYIFPAAVCVAYRHELRDLWLDNVRDVHSWQLIAVAGAAGVLLCGVLLVLGVALMIVWTLLDMWRRGSV